MKQSMDHFGALGAGGGNAFGLDCSEDAEDAEAAGSSGSGTAIVGFVGGARWRHLGMAANVFPSGQRLGNFNEDFELATCHLFLPSRAYAFQSTCRIHGPSSLVLRTGRR